MILDTKPYLLYETVGMLVKYVNRVSMLEIRDTMHRLYSGCLDQTWDRRLECLQEIIDRVCRDVNREDPEIQYFFSRREPGNSADVTTIARMMTSSFASHESHSLTGEAEVLKQSWKKMQELGYQLAGGLSGVSFIPLPAGAQQPSLIRQVYNLKFASDFAMEVLNVLEDFDATMDRLVRLIAPYGQRLEQELNANSWLLESLGAYWAEQFQHTTPEAFWSGSKLGYQSPPTNQECLVCFSLMNCTILQSETSLSILHPDRSLYVFGCTIVAECSQRMYSEDTDRICAAFRALGDKSKMSLLMRLADGRSYCQQLAEEAQCNTGNMSRNLASLSKYGFLKQEQEQSRTYYTTDLEEISRFFREVEDLLARRRKV